MASSPSTSIRKLTEAGLARELGVSRQAVHDLVSRSILSKDKDGLIDFEMAKIALANRVRPSAKTAEALKSPSVPGVVATQTPETDSATSFHVAKTLRESTEAQIAKHKLLEMRGEVINRETITKAFFEIGRMVRDSLMAASRRIAAEVASVNTAEGCEQVIDREHRMIMENMVAEFREKARIDTSEQAG